MSTKNIFRIHPSIGIARVGNSEEYYIGPETMAGMDGETPDEPTGGLPIKVGQETQTITSNDLRDAEGKLKRQAARFKIFAYSDTEINQYPSGAGSEIKVGSQVQIDGTTKTVKSILWQVHLANKKANSWDEPEQGIDAYTPANGCDDRTPIFRNPDFEGSKQAKTFDDGTCCNSQEVLSQKVRLENLVLDAGPHVIGTGVNEQVDFNRTNANSILNESQNGTEVINYPKLFPSYEGANPPENEQIDSLGEMLTDSEGRLLVVGAFGKASGFKNDGSYDPNATLEHDVNNNNWFDDTADGPVNAVLLFEDGTKTEIEGSSWVVTTDPSYAPQIPNVVSLWEDMYNTWVEQFDLEPTLFDKDNTDEIPVTNPEYNLGIGYNPSYQPNFENQIKPILNAAHLQMWATNLVSEGQGAHKKVAEQSMENPTWKSMMAFMRNPNIDNNDNPENGTRMPLSLGDSEEDFLAFSRTQYFFIYQWLIANQVSSGSILGPGESLDRNVLGNCLGGRFSPGIEMTFIVRDTFLYQPWKTGTDFNANGPFRINQEKIDYTNLNQPVLGVGYTPLRTDQVQPGDICKFMSVPWHTDYNSCATHTTVPNLQNSKMTYWSWPAQRPVAVYTYDDLVCNGGLDFQRFSVRGTGTNAYYDASAPDQVKVQDQDTVSARVGRYQQRLDFLQNWQNVGTVIQGTAIDQKEADKSKVSKELLESSYLEVQSCFENESTDNDECCTMFDDSNKVIPGPIPENHAVAPPEPVCPHAAAARAKK